MKHKLSVTLCGKVSSEPNAFGEHSRPIKIDTKVDCQSDQSLFVSKFVSFISLSSLEISLLTDYNNQTVSSDLENKNLISRDYWKGVVIKLSLLLPLLTAFPQMCVGR